MNEAMTTMMIVKFLYNELNIGELLKKAVLDTDSDIDNRAYKIIDLILKERGGR